MRVLVAGAARLKPRRMARQFELTNRLRREGTRNLLDAARDADVRRVITQGLAYAYRPGEGLAGEDAPLWDRPPAQFAPVLAALIELERRTLDANGLVLRFGQLYGPGSSYAPGGSTVSPWGWRRSSRCAPCTGSRGARTRHRAASSCCGPRTWTTRSRSSARRACACSARRTTSPARCARPGSPIFDGNPVQIVMRRLDRT